MLTKSKKLIDIFNQLQNDYEHLTANYKTELHNLHGIDNKYKYAQFVMGDISKIKE